MEPIWSRHLPPAFDHLLADRSDEAAFTSALGPAIDAAGREIAAAMEHEQPWLPPVGESDVTSEIASSRSETILALARQVDLFDGWYGDVLSDEDSPPLDDTGEALRLLAARGVRVAREVLVLVLHGFADGAIARSRTIAESAICAELIGSRSETGIARRFLDHVVHDRLTRVTRYDAHAALLGLEPHTDEERQAIVDEAESSVVDGTDYGWAAEVVTGRPDLYKMRKAANLDHLAVFIDLAHHHIHPTSHGLIDLDIDSPETGRPLLGPSPQRTGLALEAASHGFTRVAAAAIMHGIDAEHVAHTTGLTVLVALADLYGEVVGGT